MFPTGRVPRVEFVERITPVVPSSPSFWQRLPVGTGTGTGTGTGAGTVADSGLGASSAATAIFGMVRKAPSEAKSKCQPTLPTVFKAVRRSQRDPVAARAAAQERAEATKATSDPNWSGWASGETELAAFQRVGKWPDGKPLGRGHGQPYLQPLYAHAMRSKRKTVEGRPGTGWAANVKANDWVTFKVTASGGKKLVCRATRVRRFATFEAMVRTRD